MVGRPETEPCFPRGQAPGREMKRGCLGRGRGGLVGTCEVVVKAVPSQENSGVLGMLRPSSEADLSSLFRR